MDRLAAITTFAAVVETGSFSAAARRLGVGQPAVSKAIAQLEENLGVRLLVRSSRRLMPTEAGQAYYEHGLRAIEAADEAEGAARGAGASVRGRLRISAAVTFARLHIVPRLHSFLRRHPELSIDVVLDDRNVDLLSEGIEVALRMGRLGDSGMTARRIAQSRRLLVGTPAYFAEAGQPRTPADLARHQEIPRIADSFRRAAERALDVGFDGVELHGANGYLPDQFLQDGSNRRQDRYGGSIENRARFFLELMDALVSVWGAGRVAARISPSGRFGTMSDSDPATTFGYLARQLDRYELAYLHVIEPRIRGIEEVAFGAPAVAARSLRRLFRGPIVAAGGFSVVTAEHILAAGDADLVAFGRHFLANPDLPERFRRGLPLNHYDRTTFYGGDHRGYTDYPFHPEVAR